MRKPTANPAKLKDRNKRTITDINPSTAISIDSSNHLAIARSSTQSPGQTLKKVKKISMDIKKKPGRKRSPRQWIRENPLFEADVNDPNYFEHRTVNSMADLPEPVEHKAEPVPRKRLKRHKMEPIDSEVEIFKTIKLVPVIQSNNSIPSDTKQKIAVIRQIMLRNTDLVDADKLNREKSKIRRIKKKVIPLPPQVPNTTVSTDKSLQKQQTLKAVENKQLEPVDKYPVLKNQELVNKFLSVSMTNNQKGRIRQVFRDMLKGTSWGLLPDLINNRIQTILKSSPNLTDTDLRKIRILYNMLKKAIGQQKELDSLANEKKEIIAEKKKKEGSGEVKEVEKKKVKKKPKRYVVFVGNLPVHVTKEQILEHFSSLRECIKDVRIQPRGDNKKSSFAYLELDNEPSYQYALSQHHSMMGKKRINVLYSINKKSKLTKTQAKAKGAKLVSMAKKGQLVGSIAMNKKRSARRAKMRKAARDAHDAENAHKARKLYM